MYKLIMAALILALSGTNYAACSNSITHIAPDSRYELLNGNTEVKDTQTALIWQRCSLGQTWSGISCLGSATTYNWANALQTAKNMGNGWRVPNIKELDSLIEQACNAPSINEKIFPNTPTSYSYWSSSTYSKDDYSTAWTISFLAGDSFSSFGKSNNHYVRLVRSAK